LYIIKELAHTEKTYVAGLKDAIEVWQKLSSLFFFPSCANPHALQKFYRPLLAVAQGGTEPTAKAEDIKLIFSNLEHFLPLNQNLLNSSYSSVPF
jgi:hypothetical protein